MPQRDGPTDRSEVHPPALTPIGKLGFRGRRATPKEREQILNGYFFEGDRRIGYLQQYFVLMLLSAAIAGLGLVNDSAAVVIGAMLVAPLMTPIMATAAAMVEGWGRRVAESLAIVGAGALVAIGVGIVISLAPVLRTGVPLPDELLARTNPNLVDLGIAIAAGAAGGFVAVRTEASGALPGVGIAVALVPPLATVGITLGLGEIGLAFGALLLFMTNVVAIVLAAGLVLVGAGFAAYRGKDGERESMYARVAVIVGVVVVAVPLLMHSTERWARDGAVVTTAETVAAWAPDLTLRDVEIEHGRDLLHITVTVTGTKPPPDIDELAQQLAVELDQAVELDVAFAPMQSTSAPAP